MLRKAERSAPSSAATASAARVDFATLGLRKEREVQDAGGLDRLRDVLDRQRHQHPTGPYCGLSLPMRRPYTSTA